MSTVDDGNLGGIDDDRRVYYACRRKSNFYLKKNGTLSVVNKYNDVDTA